MLTISPVNTVSCAEPVSPLATCQTKNFIKSLAWGISSKTSTSLSPSLLPNSSHRFQSFGSEIWSRRALTTIQRSPSFSCIPPVVRNGTSLPPSYVLVPSTVSKLKTNNVGDTIHLLFAVIFPLCEQVLSGQTHPLQLHVLPLTTETTQQRPQPVYMNPLRVWNFKVGMYYWTHQLFGSIIVLTR